MTLATFTTAAYLIAGLLFILALNGLSDFTTAKRGNACGMLGMILALVATVLTISRPQVDHKYGAAVTIPAADLKTWGLLAAAILIGASVGLFKARKVEMTGMPELIAQLHSFVGLAAVLVGFNAYLRFTGTGDHGGMFHLNEVWIGILIGAVTFTGSIVAWGKLSGKLKSSPARFPGGANLTITLLVACVVLGVAFAVTTSIWLLIALTVLSLIVGYMLVAAIGGADMPVVISMLNSYSGWAAALTGFTLGIDVLIVVGALVGSSGAILSYIMCRAMNRSFISVILGGFGDTPIEAGDEADR